MKWYAVDAHNGSWAQPAHSEDPDEHSNHTVSNTPGVHGWENDSGCPGYGLTWEQAQDIEGLSAEVERLRAERDAFRKEADEAREQANAFSLDGVALDSEVTAYRAAVADLRKLFARGPKYWAHVDEFMAILDKLPEDAT